MRSGFQQKGLPRLFLGSSSVQTGRALSVRSLFNWARSRGFFTALPRLRPLFDRFGPPDRSILVAVASDPRAAAMPSKIVFTALPSAA